MHIWHTLLQLPKCTIKPHKDKCNELGEGRERERERDWNFDISCTVTSVPDLRIHVMLRLKYSKLSI